MAAHYVCAECAAESNTPKDCDTEDCPLKGKAMGMCNCTDGSHNMALNENA